MSDAFRDAELLVNALVSTFSGRQTFEAALAAYQATRDERSLGMYELTCQFASMEPPPPEMQAMLGGVVGDQGAMDGFCRMNAGILPPAEFFAAQAARARAAAAN
jgi:2-polyprenyl-6-methoxyphenol hydroxylase-like FAD-dependent oxidoreductase